MPRYIDVDKLLNDFNNTKLYKLSGQFERLIRDQPFADVQEVKRGKWGRSILADDFFRCSVCGAVWNRKFEYCPHCGAKMDGGDGDANTELHDKN